ncbi:MAG: hypothetical protein PHU82_00025 [Candidatus Pacebacteria bacterium]|jgi:hypothetical protein|nr:hypothetical protein [Candidatus Paceibacterota bacterium]MDD4994365.1 hypothetical protein [Candidatus Paceibacterota bacterium]MDD5535070.1 hypothetical protein [Candidatus Paceibacterota bacterium]
MEKTFQYLVFLFIGLCGIFVGRKIAIKRALRKKLENKNVN